MRIMSSLACASGRVSAVIMCVALLFLVFALAVQVILRYVFKAPMPGAEEIGLFGPAWLWFFAAAYAIYRRFWISTRLPLPTAFKNKLNLVIPYFNLIVTLTFCYFAYIYCYWNFSQGIQSISLRIPLGYISMAVLIGLVLMAVCLVQEAVDRTSVFITGRKKKSNSR